MTEFAKAASAESLRAIVVEGNLRPGRHADAVCGVVPYLYAEPATEAELARVLECASHAGIRVTPRGGGTKLDWGNAPQSIDLMISTAKLTKILEYAPGDMTLAVEAGVTISRVQSTLSAHRQRLALDPLWPDDATVGGVISANDSGALRLRYGGVRDLIIGITVVLSDGTIAKSGGKVVKNVAGYDLPKLMSGSLGTLGVITKAVFRLHPLPESSRTLTFVFIDRETANQFMLAVADSIAVPTGLQMRTGAAGVIEVDVRLDGIDASIAAQEKLVREKAFGAACFTPERDPWQAREHLCNDAESASICKLSMLPNQLGSTAEFVRESLSANAEWTLVMNSTGLAWLRAESSDPAQIADFVLSLRTFLAATGGTLVLLKAPPAVRHQVDIWGNLGSALPLMKRIKEQFDPRGILNRGRFVGGI